ncbi:hypothetical protein NE237_031224 [Protea cynaroides]|uniref:Uncharacterized protein n=1 Tax=Protea cynaroides TaxID=273540 RepID=A0A9Q0L120_9MAGN|nr:hypothetical protein NE237_031224 [Protea cynaroides]
MSAGGSRPSVPGAGIIGGEKGYGRGAGSNGVLRNRSEHGVSRQVRFADPVVEDAATQGARSGSVINRSENSRIEGGVHSSAMARVHTGLRVDTGSHAALRVATGSRAVVATGVGGVHGSSTFTGETMKDGINLNVSGSVSHVSVNDVRRASDRSFWVPMPEVLADRISEKDSGIESDESNMERSVVDLGRYLGFPLLENDAAMDGSRSKGTQSKDFFNGNKSFWKNRRSRKRHRGVDRDKGKGVADSVEASIGVPSKNGTAGSSEEKTSGHRSFASALTGMTDLNSLPEPVTEGCLTRVVILQYICERQMEKYKLAIIGRVFTNVLRLSEVSHILADQWGAANRFEMMALGKGGDVDLDGAYPGTVASGSVVSEMAVFFWGFRGRPHLSLMHVRNQLALIVIEIWFEASSSISVIKKPKSIPLGLREIPPCPSLALL